MISSQLYAAHYSTRWKFASTLLLCGLADFLFLSHSSIGWTAGIFSLALLSGMLLHNWRRLDSFPAVLIAALVTGQGFALMFSPSTLNYILLLCGFGALYAMTCGIYKAQTLQWLWFFVRSGCWGLILPVHTCLKWLRVRQHKKHRIDFYTILRNWLLPVIASLFFLGMFSDANPLIERWLRYIDFGFLTSWLESERLIFWVGFFVVSWMVLRPRIRASMYPKPRNGYFVQHPAVQWVFSPAAILRALIVFNLLFFAQTAMDAVYLWGGRPLPDSVSYAEYARRGAYPLMFTALLAAAFVLIALRDGSESARNRFVRILVYAWVAQNIMLVMSAMQRLLMYVEVYSLTYMRVAAFIWMALVACGLGLIILRLIRQKSGTWLTHANLIMLVSVLYICSFANIGGLIANFNVNHSASMKGGFLELDVWYLESRVGLPALPALQRYAAQGHLTKEHRERVEETISNMQNRLSYRQSNWRSWQLDEYWLSLEGGK